MYDLQHSHLAQKRRVRSSVFGWVSVISRLLEHLLSHLLHEPSILVIADMPIFHDHPQTGVPQEFCQDCNVHLGFLHEFCTVHMPQVMPMQIREPGFLAGFLSGAVDVYEGFPC